MPQQRLKRASEEPQSTDQQVGPYQELSESFVNIPLSSQQPQDSRSPFVLEDEELFSSALRRQTEKECSSESQVDNLWEMLGSSDGSGVSKDDIRMLLHIYDGDVDRVASCLLEQDFSSLQLVKDFQLAQTLQEEEQRSSTHIQQDDDTITDSGTPLPASSRERFIHSVKEILIPQLANELVGMRFPDIENDGQKYEYHLRNLSLELLNIPIGRVQVTMTHPDIHVDCEDVELKISIGHWEYCRKGTLSFQDDGQAVCILSGIHVGLIIRSYLEQEQELPHLGVRKCTVSVGELHFRFTGTKASWLYNLLSSLFQSQLKKNVEAVLQTTVSSAVSSQLNQWTQWIFAAP
ncbi:hypothetical protein GpartN1_g4200.t1 [Galdieria partita]|uniref:Lipid-binding serum glycoprotein N-terminal domain-containing protein n=1 Tax=Galdieria partita TaxID=83374 RepID=A0A9C7PYB4_9RHOD|nr:hypothetical protein GpartN1_g4200.t1 [Galdieria partita]